MSYRKDHSLRFDLVDRTRSSAVASKSAEDARNTLSSKREESSKLGLKRTATTIYDSADSTGTPQSDAKRMKNDKLVVSTQPREFARAHGLKVAGASMDVLDESAAITKYQVEIKKLMFSIWGDSLHIHLRDSLDSKNPVLEVYFDKEEYFLYEPGIHQVEKGDSTLAKSEQSMKSLERYQSLVAQLKAVLSNKGQSIKPAGNKAAEETLLDMYPKQIMNDLNEIIADIKDTDLHERLIKNSWSSELTPLSSGHWKLQICSEDRGIYLLEWTGASIMDTYEKARRELEDERLCKSIAQQIAKSMRSRK